MDYLTTSGVGSAVACMHVTVLSNRQLSDGSVNCPRGRSVTTHKYTVMQYIIITSYVDLVVDSSDQLCVK